MNITEIFIRRPVMTTLVMMGIVLFGVAGYRALPVSDLPNVDFPTIQVNASLPGASPETMAASVATPLERQFSTIPGLDSMTSTSYPRHHQHHPAVHAGPLARRRRAGRAVGHRRRRYGACRRACPHPPTFRKVNPADQPILNLSLNSPTLPLSVVDEYAETLICAAHLHDQRRGAGQRHRRAEVRRARPARSQPAGRPRHRHRRSRDGARAAQRQPAHRHAVGPAPGVHRAGQRPADERRGVPAADRGLPQRLARCGWRNSAG